MDLELRVLRAIGHAIPAIPRAHAIVNRLVRPLYTRRPREFVQCNVLGSTMELDPHDAVDAQLIFCPQLYDRNEINFLRKVLRPGDTFVDVGAHVGFYSLMASGLVSDGRVFAIEANPRTFETLRKNSLLNGNRIAVRNAGVSDRDEILELWIQTRGNKGGTSFLSAGDGTPVRIQCRPLALLLQEAGIDTITALKIDIEGFEHKVLSQFLATRPSKYTLSL